MIPENDNLVADYTETVLPSMTWKLDFDKNLATTYITDKEAIYQSAILALATERYEYIIYSMQYGVELIDLFGENQQYVMAEIKRRITDALMVDDRIESITDFTFERKGRALHVYFTINTNVGNVDMETEVEL